MDKLRRYLHPKMREEKLRYELPYQETMKRVGKQLERRLHEKGIYWWDRQLDDYKALPVPKENFLLIWERYYKMIGEDPEKFDVWLLSTRSMQYAWTSNVTSPTMAEVSGGLLEFGGVAINSSFAKEKGIENGDEVVIESPFAKTQARAIVREGIRPDVAVISGQFGQWKTHFAKDLGIPNVTDHTKLDLALLDAGGSGADLVKVKIYKKGAGK